MKTNKAIQHFGSQAELARVLGLSRSAVCRFGAIMPELRAMQVERATNGELKYDPKVYGTPIK